MSPTKGQLGTLEQHKAQGSDSPFRAKLHLSAELCLLLKQLQSGLYVKGTLIYTAFELIQTDFAASQHFRLGLSQPFTQYIMR